MTLSEPFAEIIEVARRDGHLTVICHPSRMDDPLSDPTLAWVVGALHLIVVCPLELFPDDRFGLLGREDVHHWPWPKARP